MRIYYAYTHARARGLLIGGAAPALRGRIIIMCIRPGYLHSLVAQSRSQVRFGNETTHDHVFQIIWYVEEGSSDFLRELAKKT